MTYGSPAGSVAAVGVAGDGSTTGKAHGTERCVEGHGGAENSDAGGNGTTDADAGNIEQRRSGRHCSERRRNR